MKIALLRN